MDDLQRSPLKRLANTLVNRLGGRTVASLAVGAVLVPLLAVSAVFGLEGGGELSPSDAIQLTAIDVTSTGTPAGDTATATATPEPLSAAMAAHANGNGCDDELFADGTRTPTPGGPRECTVGNSGDHRQNGQRFATGTATPTADPSLSPSPTATATATGPHTNGKGCDDVLFKDGAKPPVHGGPAECTVGNSADHRQNGKKDGTPTATATSTATGTASPTGTATATSTSEPSGPHNNGRGCDDVNEHKPGGPQGCDVGNSGPNRKNGDNNSSTPDASGTTAATGNSAPGNSGNAGKKPK